MKLRYTPLQFKCYSIEEVPKYKNTVFQEKANLRKMPVIICSLHSMIVLASVAAKNYYKKNIKITYVMTDGGSLPISFSKIVKKLKSSNLIDKTITVGHSFGGDIEAVNIYTGLIAAKSIINSDITIVSMGPGIVGTSTKYGFTGIEQGEIVNAVSSINGRPIVIPRISFMDTRIRHKGISHHTLTTLKEIALKSAYLTIHKMEKSKLLYVFKQLNENNIIKKHKIILEDGKPGLNKFKDYSFDVKTMGRNTEVDKDFFLNCSAAGVAALKMIN